MEYVVKDLFMSILEAIFAVEMLSYPWTFSIQAPVLPEYDAKSKCRHSELQYMLPQSYL